MKRRFIYFGKIYNIISAGQAANILLKPNGQIWTWGLNNFGQLGNGIFNVNRCVPVSIIGNKKTFISISMAYHSMGLDKNGQVWSWGRNSNGELGNNSINNVCTPVSIHGAKKTFKRISAGYFYSFGINNNNQTWGWGSNNYGQLGDNSINSKITPVSIHGAKKTFCRVLSGTAFTTVGLDKYGQIWCWGRNNHGQLGNNTIIDRCTPISILGAKKTFCYISAGSFDNYGIDKNGLVWGWGRNNYGQLGDNTTTSRRTPVSILGQKKTFCYVNGSSAFVLMIDNKGQVWGWGRNQYGQLGDNSITNRATPVSIHGAKKTFCYVSVALWNSIGVDKYGQVWTWGHNTSGQIGDNTTLSRRTPVRVCNI